MKRFPIMVGYQGTPAPCPSSIPWDAIAPYEGHALENHQQTLERLAERGGLDPVEAYFVMTGRRWTVPGPVSRETEIDACQFLDKIVCDQQRLRTDLRLAIKYLKEHDNDFNFIVQQFIERVEKEDLEF